MIYNPSKAVDETIENIKREFERADVQEKKNTELFMRIKKIEEQFYDFSTQLSLLDRIKFLEKKYCDLSNVDQQIKNLQAALEIETEKNKGLEPWMESLQKQVDTLYEIHDGCTKHHQNHIQQFKNFESGLRIALEKIKALTPEKKHLNIADLPMKPKEHWAGTMYLADKPFDMNDAYKCAVENNKQIWAENENLKKRNKELETTIFKLNRKLDERYDKCQIDVVNHNTILISKHPNEAMNGAYRAVDMMDKSSQANCDYMGVEL